MISRLLTDAGRGVYSWLDARLGVGPKLNRLLYDPVPERGGWFYTLGAALFVLLIIQAVTGIFLTMYYVPSWNEARESLYYIQNEVYLGWLVRGIHYWNMVALVLLIGLHLLRTFISAAFKRPREITWILGVTLLILMLFTAFTGGMLRLDQSGYYDMVVGTAIASWTPLVGPLVSQLWRGGEVVNPVTLTRTFSLHIWLLPAPLILLAGAHIGLVVLQGQFGSWVNYVRRRPGDEPESPDEAAARAKLEDEILDRGSRKVNLPNRVTWFFPYHVYKESIVTFGCFFAVFLAALLFPVPIEDPVDPTTTQFAPSAMWFLVFVDQLLVIFPGAWLIPGGAVVLPTVFIGILYLFPWIERDRHYDPMHRLPSILFILVSAAAVLILAMLAASRVYNFEFVNAVPFPATNPFISPTPTGQ